MEFYTIVWLVMCCLYMIIVGYIYKAGWLWIDSWQTFGLTLYVIQMIFFPILLEIFISSYLFEKIEASEPTSCSPSPGGDEDNSTKFFANQLNKCGFTITSSNKDGLRYLFLTILILKTFVDLFILYFIMPTKGVLAKAAGKKLAAGAKSAGQKAVVEAKSAGKKAAESARKAKSAMFDKVDPDA